MKKSFLFILIVVLIVSFVACKNTDKAQKEENTSMIENSELNNLPSMPPPPQPIHFDNIDTAIVFLKAPDYSKYPETYQSAYQNMVASFQQDKYITTITSSVAQRLNLRVTLFPEVTYEDVGVQYWFELDGNKYEVLIYNTKVGDEYSVDLSKETISDYYKKRFDLSSKNDTDLSVRHSFLKSVIFKESNNKNAAHCMIDKSHYIVIRTNAEKSLLAFFVESLTINKMEI